MRILFLSHYYPPEVNAPASRTAENCRAWAAAGHDVTVVTAAPSHPQGKLYPGYRNKLRQEERVDGVRIIRLWTFIAANEGFLLRALNYLSFFFSVLLARAGLPKADVVISTSPQFFCGLAGLLASRGAPWALEVRDLWPESIVAVGAMRRGLATRLLEWLESYAYRRADRIISVTEGFVPHIEARGGAGKVSVVKNGVDLGRFDGAPSEAFKREIGAEGKFVAAYVGTHGMAHGLDIVLDAAGMLADDPRIMFLLVGDGAERARLMRRKDELGLANVVFLGQRPKSDMPAIWRAADASLILLKRSDTFTKVLPSKMFEAMAMRKPIVLGVEGEAHALLEEAGAGLAIPPESAPALAAAVRRLAQDEGLVRRMGESGRHFVELNFDRDSLAAQYLDILCDLARARSDGTAPRTAAGIEERAA